MNDKDSDANVNSDNVNNDVAGRPRLVPDRSDSDESVARLLRLAGHRPEVPAHDAAMVKQAARVEWQAAVRAQRRRTFFTRGAGGLLAAAALILLVVGTGQLRRGLPVSGEPIAWVETTTGQVRASHGEGEPGDLSPGQALLPGTVVETAASAAGTPGRVAFRLADGTSVRLDTGTRVEILSSHELALDRGAVYADSGPGVPAPASDRWLEIHTPLGVARDIGTQFEVRLAGAASTLEVRVREGKVILDRDRGEGQTVRAGFELAVRSDGSAVQTPIPSFGSSWDWTIAVLPAFDAEGRPLQEVLEWAVRESGWQLGFADSALAVQAAKDRVSGSVDGLTPEEAAGIFLTSSGMSYQLEDGVFLVEPAGP